MATGLTTSSTFRRRTLRSRVLSAFGAIALFSVVWRFAGAPAYRQWVAGRPETANPVFRFQALVGDRIEHTFVGMNGGRSKITIAGVAAECGCTAVKEDLANRIIAPGESFEVPVRIELTTPADEFLKRIFVRFDGGAESELQFRCEGVVREVWNYSPASLEFRPGESTKLIRLTPSTQRAVLPTRVSVNHPGFSAVLRPAQADDEWTIEVRQLRGESSRTNGAVFIESEPFRPPVVIPIRIGTAARH